MARYSSATDHVPEPRHPLDPHAVIAQLGEGGMGTVYRATRDGDFEQTVALKRIKPGMDSEAVLARLPEANRPATTDLTDLWT